MSPKPHPDDSSSPTSTDAGLDPAAIRIRDVALRFGYLERRGQRAVAEVLAAHGLSLAMYHVLFRLSWEGTTPQSDLALDAGLDAAGVSRLLTRLSKRGLIVTHIDPDDRRRRLVEVTPAGRALEQTLAPAVYATMREVVTGLSEAEEVELLRLLDKAARATAARNGDRFFDVPSDAT
jgi:DNA-binding MarR family transcriptional regulator